MSDPSVTCSIKRFCRRCKAHSFNVAVHSACPFRNCQCPDCSKIAQNNEVARERARKRRADQTAALTLIPTSTDIPVTVQQVLQLGKNNSQVDQDRKRLSTSALQAGTYQLNLKCNYFLLLQMRVFCLSTFGKQFYPRKYGYCVSVRITHTCTLQKLWTDISFNKPTRFLPVARQKCDFV